MSSFGIDKIWSANQQGLMLLLPLYIFSFVCTYACYRLDQEAREGDVYAKQKAAYHRDMDQYLNLKKAYYEKAADGLGLSPPPDEES